MMNESSWFIFEDNTKDIWILDGFIVGLKELAIHLFRIIDKNGKVIYKGKSDYVGSFEPLDRVCKLKPNCHSIQYKIRGRWKTC